MADEATLRRNMAQAQAISEELARETNVPVDQVAEIFASQSAELERTARVKTYISVLAKRQTRNILNTRRTDR